MKYDVRLTEEIARWVFEVHVVRHAPDWFIAFTNPTAGPWKTLKVPNPKGELEEVYRFGREEERPDVVLVSDKHKLVIIVEAKDSLPKLIQGGQPEKSARVVVDMWTTLSRLNSDIRWSHRAKYQFIGALLWGAEAPAAKSVVDSALADLSSRLKAQGLPNQDAVLGIEVVRDSGHFRPGAHVHPSGAFTDVLGSLALK